MTGATGDDVTGQHWPPPAGHGKPESVVTTNQNARSRSAGMGGHDKPESLVTTNRKGWSRSTGIPSLRVGDPIGLSQANGKWVLTTSGGFEIGSMARAFKPPPGKQFVSAKVLAIHSRTIGMVDDGFKNLIKVDEWEVVLPEMVFA